VPRVTSDTKLIQAVTMLARPSGPSAWRTSSPALLSLEDHLQRAVNVPSSIITPTGAGVMVLAGLLNALPLVGKLLAEARMRDQRAGSAGVGVARLLLAAGAPPPHCVRIRRAPSTSIGPPT